MAAVTSPVKARAPGKINLFLRVGAALDDGFHNVVTAYQAVSLFDEVTASAADDFSVSVGGSVALNGVPEDASNLALQAAHLLARRTGYSDGVHLTINKDIPVAGGMGG